MNKFIFIIPFYNVSEYITECAESLISQEYKNWQAVFVDDCSTDKSISKIPFDNRFTITRNESKRTCLFNIHNAIINANLDNNDIVCLLDGDDKLLNASVCTLLNDIYMRHKPLFTYGQYLTSTNQMGHCSPINTFKFQNLRTKKLHFASHLKTFRYSLYKELMFHDPELNCFKDRNGEFYNMAADVAIMIPLMEIAGVANIYFNSSPIYYYRLHKNNDHAIDIELQRKLAGEIFSKPAFKKAD